MSKDEMKAINFNLLVDIAEKVGGIVVKVNSLEASTKKQDHALNEIKQRTANIDTWKDGIIHEINLKEQRIYDTIRGEFDKRFIPLESDFKSRNDFRIKAKTSFFKAMMRALPIVGWLMIIYVLVKVFGEDKAMKIIKFF